MWFTLVRLPRPAGVHMGMPARWYMGRAVRQEVMSAVCTAVYGGVYGGVYTGIRAQTRCTCRTGHLYTAVINVITPLYTVYAVIPVYASMPH